MPYAAVDIISYQDQLEVMQMRVELWTCHCTWTAGSLATSRLRCFGQNNTREPAIAIRSRNVKIVLAHIFDNTESIYVAAKMKKMIRGSFYICRQINFTTARLQIFIHLSPTVTKLCHIKSDYPVHIIWSKCLPAAETHAFRRLRNSLIALLIVVCSSLL